MSCGNSPSFPVGKTQLPLHMPWKCTARCSAHMAAGSRAMPHPKLSTADRRTLMRFDSKAASHPTKRATPSSAAEPGAGGEWPPQKGRVSSMCRQRHWLIAHLPGLVLLVGRSADGRPEWSQLGPAGQLLQLWGESINHWRRGTMPHPTCTSPSGHLHSSVLREISGSHQVG